MQIGTTTHFFCTVLWYLIATEIITTLHFPVHCHTDGVSSSSHWQIQIHKIFTFPENLLQLSPASPSSNTGNSQKVSDLHILT